MKTRDETVDSMFDEITETKIAPDGSVEVNLVEDAAQELECAVKDFTYSWRRFSKIDMSVAATSGAQLGIEWWRSLQYLALADSRLKEAFIGGDRSPRSIRLFHQYKLRLIEGGGKKLPADA